MSTFIRCDGCHQELGGLNSVAITGARSDGTCGLAPLPDGEFHWCASCGKKAFGALRFQRGRDTAAVSSVPASGTGDAT